MDGDGRQIRFSGSKLSPDLSLPRLRARWHEVDGPSPAPRTGRRQGPSAPEQRRQRVDGAARALGRAVDEPVTPAVGVSTAEVATGIAELGHALPGETGNVLLIVGQLARVAAGLRSRGTTTQRQAADPAFDDLQRFVGRPGPHEVVLLSAASWELA